MKKAIKPHIGVVGVETIGFLLLLVAFVAPAFCENPVAIKKKQEVTLVVPAAVFERTTESFVGTVFSTLVTVDDEGRLVLGGDEEWRSNSLPMVLPGRIEKVKKEEDKFRTRVVFKPTDKYWKFRFYVPRGKDLGLLSEVFVPISDSGARDEAKNSFFSQYCKRAFSGELDSVDDNTQRAIADALIAKAVYQFQTTDFKDERYLVVDVGWGSVKFNTQQVTSTQRVARTVMDRFIPIFKDWAPILASQEAIYGIKVDGQVAFGDFTNKYASPSFDDIEFYVSIEMANEFAEFEITDQDLVDESIVLVNGSRARVDLSEQ